MSGGSYREYSINVHVFTADGTWHKPANLATVYVILRGAGGGGGTSSSTAGGGGGGAAIITDTMHASQVDDTVAITVGISAAGQDGGDSAFGDVIAQGGKAGGSSGRAIGGVSPWRGGMGGEPGGGDGESVSNAPVNVLSGGGGGASWPGHGGTSGIGYDTNGNYGARSGALLWPEWWQTGYGGGVDSLSGWPSGGGRSRESGAAGCVTIMETLVHEVSK